jgi:hypothetical protein
LAVESFIVASGRRARYENIAKPMFSRLERAGVLRDKLVESQVSELGFKYETSARNNAKPVICSIHAHLLRPFKYYRYVH